MTTIEKLENLRERLYRASRAWFEDNERYADVLGEEEDPDARDACEQEYYRRCACEDLVDDALRCVDGTLRVLRDCGLEVDDEDD